jgi:hypothetical protein
MTDIMGSKGNDEHGKFSYKDFLYDCLAEARKLRTSDDHNKFHKLVSFLELTIDHMGDEIYLDEIKALEGKKASIMQQGAASEKDIHTWYFDDKYNILAGLIYRFNQGILKVREYLLDSEMTRKISAKLIDGIGQIVTITGPQGSGKSYSGLYLATSVLANTGQKFNIKNVAFTIEEFFELYNDTARTPPGSYILFEEIGVNVNSKDSMTKISKIFTKISQTFRYRQLLIIFTAPDLGFIDVSLRKQMHWWLETIEWNKKNKICTLKPWIVSNQQRTGDIWYMYPINDVGNQVVEMRIPELNPEIAKRYEVIQREYKDGLGRTAAQDVDDLKEKTVLSKGSLFMKQVELFGKYKEEGMLVKDIEVKMDISNKTASNLSKKWKEIQLNLLSKGITDSKNEINNENTE